MQFSIVAWRSAGPPSLGDGGSFNSPLSDGSAAIVEVFSALKKADSKIHDLFDHGFYS